MPLTVANTGANNHHPQSFVIPNKRSADPE
jgi:hypothetical protein